MHLKIHLAVISENVCACGSKSAKEDDDDDGDGSDESQMIDAGVFNFFPLDNMLESRVSEHVHVSSCVGEHQCESTMP